MDDFIKEKQEQHTPFALKISYSLVKTNEDASVREVSKLLKDHKIGALLVEKDDQMVGIISERDIVWKVVAENKSLDETKAKDIMTRNVVTVDLNEGMDKVYEMLRSMPFRHLPVRRGDKVVGMISNRDLMYLRKLKPIDK